MATRINYPGWNEATLGDDGMWTSPSSALANYLNVAHPFESNPGYDPDPILTHARMVADKIGADVVDSGAEEPDETDDQGRPLVYTFAPILLMSWPEAFSDAAFDVCAAVIIIAFIWRGLK